jgi:two-component system, OmpR family, heavy metal sensor histidine kinase CusS
MNGRRRPLRLPTTARTLAGGLALGGIAWIAVWALALLLAFDVLLSNVLANQVDTSLRARAEAVAATITLRDGRLVIAEGNDEALDTGTTVYLGQTLVEGVDLSPGLRADLVQRGEATGDREALGPVRYLALPIRSGRQQVGTIVVSSDIGARTRTGRIVGLASLGFIVLLLGFTFFALRATIARALRPVRTMGAQASAWGAEDIDRRFDPDAGPLELRELALTLNALLERISATVRHERSFTAELSHELRTPLAHLHAEVDLMTTAAGDPNRPQPADPDGLARLMTSVRRLEGLVESALSPARAEQPGALGIGHLNDVLDDLSGPTLSSSPNEPTAKLRVSGRDDVVLAVESDIARRALLPVLENARRYAVDEIHIDVSTVAGVALIAVSDDGGRLDPALAESIFTPGFRADPGDEHPGAGLGLALTRRICRSAGGDATAAVVDGRTTITLYLPCIER